MGSPDSGAAANLTLLYFELKNIKLIRKYRIFFVIFSVN